LVLATASLGVLIYLIYHVAVSIQVTYFIAVVSQDLHHVIERLFPEMLAHGGSEPQGWCEARLSEGFEFEARQVRTARSGYLQVVESEGLMQLATEHDLIST